MTLDLSQFNLHPTVRSRIEKALTRLPSMTGAPLMIVPVITTPEEKEKMLETLLLKIASGGSNLLAGGLLGDDFPFTQLTDFKYKGGIGRFSHKEYDALEVCRNYSTRGGTERNTEGLLYLVCLALLDVDLNKRG